MLCTDLEKKPSKYHIEQHKKTRVIDFSENPLSSANFRALVLLTLFISVLTITPGREVKLPSFLLCNVHIFKHALSSSFQGTVSLTQEVLITLNIKNYYLLSDH